MAGPIPRFHDAAVTGVRLRETTVTVYITDVEGAEHELTLEGLEAFQMDKFCQQNILSLVEVVTGRKPDADTALDRLFLPPHASADPEYKEAYSQAIDRQIGRIEREEVCLVLMVPSCGADLAALCREVTAH